MNTLSGSVSSTYKMEMMALGLLQGVVTQRDRMRWPGLENAPHKMLEEGMRVLLLREMSPKSHTKKILAVK